MLKKKDVMMSCWENHVMKNVKGKACLFKDGKPLDCLATPPKERYINSVDADRLWGQFASRQSFESNRPFVLLPVILPHLRKDLSRDRGPRLFGNSK